VEQEDAMLGDGFDQFALITVDPTGGFSLDVRYLVEEDPPQFRRAEPVRLR
jgi:hypothetical protein